MAQRPPDSWPPHFRTGTGRAGSLEMAQGRWRDREGLSNALPQQHRDQSSCPHPARPRRVPGAGSWALQASPPTFPWAAQGVPDDWQAQMGVCPWPLLREAQSHWRPLRAPCRPPGLAQRGLELTQGHRATRGAPHKELCSHSAPLFAWAPPLPGSPPGCSGPRGSPASELPPALPGSWNHKPPPR